MNSIATHDPRLDLCLRRSVWFGCTLLLLIPATRGHSEWLGWLPLWLLGMPLTAWWALHRFRLPHWPAKRVAASPYQRCRRGAQARRRCQPLVARRLTQAV
ncbi:MAG: hypothetical protein LH470_06270 [Lysobacter sp.]|nr:hypothetical protein [Lysobacter sp.]